MTMPSAYVATDRELMAKKCIPLIHQVAHSPDMAPVNFWQLPENQVATQFQSRDEITQNATAHLKSIFATEFKGAF